MVLDQKPDALQQSLASSVYGSCRSGELKLAGFPDYGPYIQGLKETKPETDNHEYQVSVKRGTNLVVLGAFANKWLELDQFKTEATSIIEHHNANFNAGGDFVEEAARTVLGIKTPIWLEIVFSKNMAYS